MSTQLSLTAGVAGPDAITSQSTRTFVIGITAGHHRVTHTGRFTRKHSRARLAFSRARGSAAYAIYAETALAALCRCANFAKSAPWLTLPLRTEKPLSAGRISITRLVIRLASLVEARFTGLAVVGVRADLLTRALHA